MIKIKDKEYPHAVLVGFCSTTGPESGKSYAARQLLHRFGNTTLCTGRVFSFADRLKSLCNFAVNKLLCVQAEFMDKGELLPRTHPGWADYRLRDFYIDIGTHYFREHVDKNYWVDALARDLENYLDAFKDVPVLVVVDDIRMLNEFDFIIECGGQVWDVRNTKPDRVEVKDVKGELLTELFNTQKVIFNDQTAAGLHLEFALKIDSYVYKALKFQMSTGEGGLG